MNKRTLLVLSMVLLSSSAFGQRKHYERQWHYVTTKYVTPHTPWAKPLPGGKVRMLLIAPRPCQRDTAELAQRLDLDYEVLCTYMTNHLGYLPGVGPTLIVKFSPEDRERELLEKLRRRPDVIAFGNFEWKLLPRESEYEILRQVRDGAGLLLSYYAIGQNDHFKRFLQLAEPVDDGGYVTEGVPMRSLPAWAKFKSDLEAAKRVVSTRQFRRGRVVVFNYGNYSRNTFLIPPTSNAQIHHLDYYFSLVAKAALWAAGRESRVRLVRFSLCNSAGAPVEQLDRAELPKARVAISVKAPSGTEGALWLRLRGPRGEAVTTTRVRLAEALAPKQYGMKLPMLAAGGYYVDAIARSPKGVLNWWSCFFRVTSEIQVESVEADMPTVRPGQALTATARLSRPAGPGLSVRFTATDCLGRVIERVSVPAPRGQSAISARLSFARAVANLAYIEAELMHEGQVVSRAQVRQPVNIPLPQDDFGFLCWLGESREYPWRFVRKILYEHGVDCSNIGGGPVLAEANIRACPYSTRIYATKSPVPNVRVPCLSDPNYRDRLRKKLTEVAQVARLYGRVGYSLGDENYLSTGQEYCWSDTCKACFRDYLKRTYGRLDALNAEWGSAYKTWAEIEPITLDQARKAKREGAFAQWADHRMCMEELYADIHKFCRDVIRQVDPGARVGDEGSFAMTSFSGYDWWRLAQVMDVWNIYPSRRHVLEMIRSFGQPNTYSGAWYGGYVGWSRWEARERWMPWFCVLHNLTAAWWFKAYSFARETCQEDAIAADLTPFPCFLWTAEEIRDIKHGFGKLLLNCKRDNYGVAILYSQPSVHAATIDPNYGRVPDAEMSALHLVEDLWLQYDFVAYAQLEQGVLDKRGYRVLIAPCCLSMSSKQKQAVMRFVRAGGCFIADVRPGTRDGHCKLIDDEAWQQFLGVRFGPSRPTKRGDGQLDGAIGAVRIKTELAAVNVDTSTAPVRGRALGRAAGAPVAIVNECGRGRVLLLNFTFHPYGSQPAEQTAGVRKLMLAALKTAGVVPLVSVAAEPGPIFEGEVITYTDGAARYLALLRDESERKPVQNLRVTLRDGFHVYDSRARKYLRRVNTVQLAMREGTTAVYALLPYTVQSVRLSAPSKVRPGAEVVVQLSLVCRGGKPGRHVVRLDVVGPDGKTREHYGGNVELKHGRATVSFRLALNDPKGRWQLLARDVASGQTGAAHFIVSD